MEEDYLSKRHRIEDECYSYFRDEKFLDETRKETESYIKGDLHSLYLCIKSIYQLQTSSGGRAMFPFELSMRNEESMTNAPVDLNNVIWSQSHIINHCLITAAKEYIKLTNFVSVIGRENLKKLDSIEEKVLEKDFSSAAKKIEEIPFRNIENTFKKQNGSLEELSSNISAKAYLPLYQWRETFSHEERLKTYSFQSEHKAQMTIKIEDCIKFNPLHRSRSDFFVDIGQIHRYGQSAIKNKIDNYEEVFYERYKKTRDLVYRLEDEALKKRKLYLRWKGPSSR